jgi:hypothetical protein
MEHLSDNIDYYFVTWNYNSEHWYPPCLQRFVNSDWEGIQAHSITDTDVTEKFQNKNLVAYRIIDPEKVPLNFPGSFHYLGYLAKIASLLKSRHEFGNNFLYDQVVELRPDLYISKPIRTEDIICEDYQYISNGRLTHNKECTVTECIPRLPDFYRKTNSFGNDILGNRYWYKQKLSNPDMITSGSHKGCNQILANVAYGAEWLLLEYIFSRRLTIFQNINNFSDYMCPLRPNYPEDLDSLDFTDIRDLNLKWLEIRDSALRI